MHDSRPPFALAGLSPIERAQRRVLAIMSLMPERRSDDGGFSAVVARPLGTARALRALRADGLEDETDLRRAIVLRRAAARTSDAAWNLVRAAVLGARGHTAYWLSLEEAWGEVVASARELQHMHRGWFSMAEACLVGIRNEAGEAAAEAARAVYVELHAREDSPWNLVPWSAEIPAELPTPRFGLPVVQVRDASELTAALAAATPGTTVRVTQGEYLGSFTISVPGVTLVADAPGVLFGQKVGEETLEIVTATAPCAVHGVTFKPSGGVPFVAHDFARLEECHFIGGPRAAVLAARDAAEPPTLQLARCTIRGTREVAIALEGGKLVADDVDLGPMPGTALTSSGGCVRMRDVRIVECDKIDWGDSPNVHLRKLRLERSGGMSALRGSRLVLEACEVVEGDALVLDGGSEVSAERCRFVRSRGPHVELIGSSKASFRDCDFHDAGASAIVLRPGSKSEIIGGQVVGAGEHGIAIDGAEDVRLERVALGPNVLRDAIHVRSSERIAIRSCTASGMGHSGLDVQASDVSIDGLHIRGVDCGVRAVDARLDARRLDISEARVAGVALEGATLSAIGIGLRHCRDGLTLDRSTALVRDLVLGHHEAADTGTIVVLRGNSRLGVHLVDGSLTGRVSASLLGLSRVVLRPGALVVEDGTLFCDRSALRGAAAVAASGQSRLAIHKSEIEDGSLAWTKDCELVREPTPTWTTAISPLLLVPRSEPYIAWGDRGDVASLARIARAIAKRLGYTEKLGLRETREGLRVDGPLPVIARFASSLYALQAEAGALGAALAETLE